MMGNVQTGNGIRHILSSGTEATQIPFEAIPIIDFAPMQGTDAIARQRVANDLCKACIQVGFFYIKNHGIDHSLVEDVFSQSRHFFRRPFEEKMHIHISKSSHHRGYVPLLEENTDPTARGDLHEALDFALDVPADDPDVLAGKSLYGPNVWPENLPGFQATMDRYYWELYELGRKIFQAFALALELPEDFFEAKIQKPLAQLRLLHYPPQKGPIDEKQIGIGAHSDYECFTILRQEDVPALQVLNSEGKWISAVPIPGTFIVNVGDQMARWTNDLFSSTVHRAINRSGQERYATAYFFGPHYDTLLETLPNCVTPQNPPKYQPITSGDYILSRFNETFSYRK
ncbi:MAG: 2-oxoglutarate and iron-dependent oxygenase domain-containing protein [Cyanobacteria bacterium P01_F01_bin.86]